jgi:catechol 2,3-dioxygenase-like lactoylglutathione lyase family enzyme
MELAPARRLDHVALRVPDPAASARWYCEALGLKPRFSSVWGPSGPLVLGAGEACLALLPAAGPEPFGFAHVAFAIDPAQFRVLIESLAREDVPFRLADHQIATSVYLDGPNGEPIELTAYEGED